MRIEINGLSKAFDHTVLQQISLSDDTQTLALIGRSGCGKSTLLRILGGLLAADAGTASIDGHRVEDSPAYRAKIGFVFQQSGLFTHLSARENITLPLVQVHHLSAEQANERADALLSRFGLLDEADKRPSQLSGGMRQRVAIARAIAPRPSVLLLDEPTSALDPEYTAEVLSLLHELQGDGLSFIIATHEIGFARHSCDKIAFLHQGRIAEYGQSASLTEQPQTEALGRFLSKLLKWKI